MSAVRVERHFGGVAVTGLLGQSDVLAVLVDAMQDEEMRDLLAVAAQASKTLHGDADAHEYRLANARLDDALDALGRELAGRRVQFDGQTAIDLRNGLHGARLGEGNADGWASRRRTA